MENSRCQGRGENPSRTLRSCAGSCAGACRHGCAIHNRIRRRRHIIDPVKAGIQNTPAKNQIELWRLHSELSRPRSSGPNQCGQSHCPDKKNDVARIPPRRRQIRGEEIIFSDRRDGIRDMVRFLHCYRTIHRLVGDNMGIACLRRQCRSDETLERFVRWRRCRFKPPALSSH